MSPRKSIARWLCSAVVLSGIGAVAEPFEGTGDAEARLEAITPRFPAPPTAVTRQPGDSSLPLTLEGISLFQDGSPLATDAPVADGNRTLEVRSYWMPSTRFSRSIPVVLRFESHGGKIARQESFTVGPAPNSAPWEPGGVYVQSHLVDLPTAASAMSGRVYLTVNLPRPAAPADQRACLQATALELTPALRPSDADTTEYDALFGTDGLRVARRFVLGPGARAELVLPPTSSPCRALGIVSGFAYGTVPQGRSVCDIKAVYEDGAEVPLRLVSGVTTAKTDFDYYLPGTLDHEKIAIAFSWEADYLSAAQSPFMKHAYAGVLELPREGAALERLEFRATENVLLEIRDVVLLQDPAPASESAPSP